MGLDRVFVSIRNSKSGQPRMVTATKTMRDILARQKQRKIDKDERNLRDLENDPAQALGGRPT
jgi:hypothetical protein